MSEVHRDLGGNLPSFDYQQRWQEHLDSLADPAFTDADQPLLEDFHRLGVGLQKPEWLAEPFIDPLVAKNETFKTAAHLQYLREYLQHFGQVRAAFLTATIDQDTDRRRALQDMLYLFKMPGELPKASDYNPTLIIAAADVFAAHQPGNVRADTYRTKQGSAAQTLALRRNVGCRLTATGVPELYVITELDRQQAAIRLAQQAGRQALSTARREPA